MGRQRTKKDFAKKTKKNVIEKKSYEKGKLTARSGAMCKWDGGVARAPSRFNRI